MKRTFAIIFVLIAILQSTLATAQDATPGLIPRRYSIEAATDLSISAEAAKQAALRGQDISLLEPSSASNLWNPNKNEISEPTLIDTRDEITFVGELPAREGIVRFTIQDSNNREAIVYLYKKAHNILLRKNLLEKIGYVVPPIQWAPTLKIKFKDSIDKELFMDKMENSLLAGADRWIVKSENPADNLPENLTIKLQDALVMSPDNRIYNLALGVMRPDIHRGRRILRAPYVPLALVDSPESVPLFQWQAGRLVQEQIKLYATQDLSENFETSWEDARWIGRRIMALDRRDWTEIVEKSFYPKEVELLLIEKIVSRRNDLAKLLMLDKEKSNYAELKFNPEISSGKFLVNGEIKQEFFPGYATRFSFGDPESPFKASEIGSFVLSRLQSQAFQTAMSKMNELISTNDEERFRSKLTDIAQKNFGILPVTGVLLPSIHGNVILNREISFGQYLGVNHRVQMVDSIGVSLDAGVLGGVEGLPIQVGLLYKAGVAIQRVYAHVKPVETMKKSLREPYKNMLVPFMVRNLSTLIAALDGPTSPTPVVAPVPPAVVPQPRPAPVAPGPVAPVVAPPPVAAPAPVANPPVVINPGTGRPIPPIPPAGPVVVPNRRPPPPNIAPAPVVAVPAPAALSVSNEVPTLTGPLAGPVAVAAPAPTAVPVPAPLPPAVRPPQPSGETALIGGEPLNPPVAGPSVAPLPPTAEVLLMKVVKELKGALGVGESFIITDSIIPNIGFTANWRLSSAFEADKNLLRATTQLYQVRPILSRFHIHRADENTIHVYSDYGKGLQMGVSFELKSYVPILKVNAKWGTAKAQTHFYPLSLAPKTVTAQSLKALRQSIMALDHEALRKFMKPHVIEHQIREREKNFQFLFFKHQNLNTQKNIVAKHADGKPDQKILRVYSAFTDGEDLEGYSIEAINELISVASDNSSSVSLAQSNNSNPGFSLLGKARNRVITTENDGERVTMLYERIFNGWRANQKKLKQLATKINSELGSELISPLSYRNTDLILLYRVQARAIIAQEGLLKLLDLNEAQIATALKDYGYGDLDPKVRERTPKFWVQYFAETKALMKTDFAKGLNKLNSVFKTVTEHIHLEGLKKLLGPENMAFQATVEGYRGGDEGGDSPIIGHTMGVLPPALQQLPSQKAISKLGIVEGEFLANWLSREVL